MTTFLAEPTVAPAPPETRRWAPRTTRADHRRWQDGPTPLSLADLTAITRTVAAEVVAGRHEVHLDPDHRWSRRLHADDDLDVWLLSWTTMQTAELHDHGGSIGALTVVQGALTEWHWSATDARGTVEPGPPPEELAGHGPRLRRRVVTPGHGATFGLGHVHDVSNRAEPAAVSVHAYSPPLSAMSYYEVTGGSLRRTRSELVAPGQSPE